MAQTVAVELSPDEIVAAADREIREAEELAQNLEERVRAGDETVNFEQVEKARGLKRFAELRREAARNKANALTEQLQRAQFEKLLKDHLSGAGSVDAEIEELLVQARTFVDQALTVAQRHDSHVLALAREAAGPGNPFDPDGDPELIGEARLLEYSWFETRGQRSKVIAPGQVLARLLRPYRETMSTSRRYTEIREATRA